MSPLPLIASHFLIFLEHQSSKISQGGLCMLRCFLLFSETKRLNYTSPSYTFKWKASPLLNAASLTHCTLWLSCKPSYLCVRSANLPVSDTRLVTSAYQWLADRGAVDEVAHLVTLL